MGVESVTYIKDLDNTLPAAGDNVSQGDDHIRNLKTALLNTFTKASAAVTATPAEMNYLVGVTSAIQTQINNITGSYAAKTSGYTVADTDNNAFIDCTTGSFTLTLTAAATCGNGFTFTARNSGTGEITIDPNSSETVDGVTSFKMYPGESRKFVCDGSNWVSVVLKPFALTLTTPGSNTVTIPPGYSYIGGLAWGGGGGGSKTSNPGGGGGGACAPFVFPIATLGTVGATATWTVASGGAAGTTGSGDPGGNSTIASTGGSTILTVYGGGGGAGTVSGSGGGVFGAGTSSTTGGSPGSTGNNDGFGGAGGVDVSGTAGYKSVYGGGSGAFKGAAGGASIYGGGGGAAGPADGAGGTSVFGGAGGAVSSGVGTAAGTPGGGGAGDADDPTAGARGEIRAWGIV